MNFARNTFRRLAGETQGAEIAEAAAVMPIMFMMLLGIFWFGQAFSIYGTITRAAQDGARAAVAPYCATCNTVNTPSQNAFNAVQSALTAAHLDPGRIILWAPPSPTCSTGWTNTNQGNVSVQTGVNLSVGGGGGQVCGVSVSFEYPYRFWLPFTSLNQQTLQLKAVAQVRMEAQ